MRTHTFNRRKIVHKASRWAAHGKHGGMFILCLLRNRGGRKCPSRLKPEPMFETVDEMIRHYFPR